MLYNYTFLCLFIYTAAAQNGRNKMQNKSDHEEEVMPNRITNK